MIFLCCDVHHLAGLCSLILSALSGEGNEVSVGLRK